MTTLLLALAIAGAPSPAPFEQQFTGRTLRFDYHHTGTAGEEHIGQDEVRLEGEWAGSRTRLLDTTNLGKYLFLVVDPRTNLPIYSRGFCSIYGEWETIGEARGGAWRTFHESQRFPEPRSACQLVLKKRSADGSFREIFSTLVDPESRFINRSPLSAPGRVRDLVIHGPPSRKLDLLILGDGYGIAEEGELRRDAERLLSALFEREPFRRHRSDFNVRIVELVSQASGISDPRRGVWIDSPLGLRFNSFDLDRYMLTDRNRAVREVAARAPYDALALLANTRKYGGGGIFNLWASCAAKTGQAEYIFVHELGHSIGGLADEYYTARVAYEDFTPPGVEPWEPNITALLDPDRLKWRDLVAEGTPIPTPWDQATYDQALREYRRRGESLRETGAADGDVESLAEQGREAARSVIEKARYAGRVGAYEGAGYQAKGLYRPELSCIMFSRTPDTFCKVCQRAIERVIRLHTE